MEDANIGRIYTIKKNRMARPDVKDILSYHLRLEHIGQCGNRWLLKAMFSNEKCEDNTGNEIRLQRVCTEETGT